MYVQYYIHIIMYVLLQELKPQPAMHSSHCRQPQTMKLPTCTGKSCIRFYPHIGLVEHVTKRSSLEYMYIHVHVVVSSFTATLSRKRSRCRCGECTGCHQPNCGKCPECVDMRCFGGPGLKKKACRSRKCTSLSAGHATKTSPAATEARNSATTPINTSNLAATISKLSSLVHRSGKYFCHGSLCTCTVYILLHAGHNDFLGPKPLSRDEMLKVNTYN